MPRGGRKLLGTSASRLTHQTARALVRLGKRVREERRAAGLTQEDLAAKAGIDSKYLQDIERGDANPTVAILVAIASGFDVSLAELLRDV